MRKLKNMNLYPISSSLTHKYVFVDNELKNSLTRLKFWSILGHYGITARRTGFSIKEVVFTLLIWIFLNQSSINGFLERTLQLDRESLKIEQEAEKFMTIS